MPPRKVYTADCETDPFLTDRVPEPFIWGLYCPSMYLTFDTTQEFVDCVKTKDILIYAHNGGKFDWMYILPYIKESKAQIINGRYVSLFLGRAELRDSYSIIPEPLKNFGFKKEIEYSKLERSQRHKYMESEIKPYLMQDCKGLYDAVTQYRKIAGKRKTIAGNALAFSKKLGIDPGRTNNRFDKKYRQYFYGGRVEVFKPGTHNNIYLLDIHSAYPYAMTHDHATSSDFHHKDDFKGMSKEEIQRSFIWLCCNSKGAFPKRSKSIDGGGLSFPHRYDEFYVTGWEYLVAQEFGLIDNVQIRGVAYTENKINFTPYVKHWFQYKSDHSAKDANGVRIDPVNYTIGKIMQNSLYGKLAQDGTKFFDNKVVPAGTYICPGKWQNRLQKFCELCGKPVKDHGWQLYLEYDNHEVHRRSSLWKYQQELGDEWEGKKIFYNVATGASITGFTRAHLLRAMCTLGMEHIIYCDTDGIVCDSSTDIHRIPITDNLGDWGLDDQSPLGHFAGKKLYGIRLSSVNKETGKPNVKIASKGSQLAWEDLETIIKGGVVEWSNPAPSFAIDGSAKFVHRKIRATAPLIKP